MAVDDFVGYCAVRTKESESPSSPRARQRPLSWPVPTSARLMCICSRCPHPWQTGTWLPAGARMCLASLVGVSRQSFSLAGGTGPGRLSLVQRQDPGGDQAVLVERSGDAPVGEGKRSGQDLPRLNLPPEIRQAALENYERSQPRDTELYLLLSHDPRWPSTSACSTGFSMATTIGLQALAA